MNTTLRNAVIKQLGYDPDDTENEEMLSTMSDIANYGISGGFSGFIYYSDTVEFFKKNRSRIVEMCKEYADEFGQDVISMVAGFNCLNDDPETRDEIGRAIYGHMKPDDTLVANALAWFAAEECAREFENA